MTRSRIGVLLAIASLLAISLVPGTAHAGAPRCFGKKATKVGTNGDNTIKGTRHADVIVARGGADRIDGLGGNDRICGGKGPDILLGEASRDRLNGGAGDDTLVGGRGDDVLNGGAGRPDNAQYVSAKHGVKANLARGVATGEGHDTLMSIGILLGSSHNDTLIGDGNDFGNNLVGLDGKDTLNGRGGPDFLLGGMGNDALNGGPGGDFAEYYLSAKVYNANGGAIHVDLPAGRATGAQGTDTLNNIEGASGSNQADSFIGDANDNIFVSLFNGGDTVQSGAGNDLVDGGDGADTLDAGSGSDVLGNLDHTGGITVDLTTNTDSDGDSLSGFESILGSSGDDTLSGDAAGNAISGARGNDTLAGRAGGDSLIGDVGNDSADGGAGTDECDAESEVNCELDPQASARLSSRFYVRAYAAVAARKS